MALDHGRSPTEREVLRALWASPGEHLVRSEIHRRMPRAHRPTLGRVGQILAALYKNGLLDRKYLRAQGARKAGFYALSKSGRELCQQLGFEHEERLLFPVTQRMLRTWLTRENLRQKTPGKIIAVYGFSEGLGRSTLVAHVARGLAKRLGDGEQLLVVDLDFETPRLDDFFPPRKPGQCRGLGGLLLDYERKAPRKRALWLRGALSKPEYALHPLRDVPGLAYLPSGLGTSQRDLSPSERAEALALLRAEAGMAAPTQGRSDPNLKSLGFLSELRAALIEKFERTVLDSQFGHSLGAWIATQALASELVLCAQEEDDSPATLAGLRAVLASLLRTHAEAGGIAGVMFLFRLMEPTTLDNLEAWVDRNLVMEATIPLETMSYHVDQIVYNARLMAREHQWENAHFYKHLIEWLDLSSPGESEIFSPELQALSAVLDPEKTQSVRSIAAGTLEHAPLRELARWVDWCARKESLPRETDAEGEQLIRGIVRAHSDRLLRKILAQAHRRPTLQEVE